MSALRAIAYPILRICFLWLLVFTLQRVLFFIAHHHDIPSSKGNLSFLLVFVYALRLDLSTIAYLITPYLIVKSMHTSLEWSWLRKLLKIIVYAELFIVSFIHSGETVAYYEWGHKLTTRVFMHLSMPDEVARTADTSSIFLFLLIFLIELAGATLLIKWLKPFDNLSPPKTNNRHVRIISPIITVFLGLPISLLFARGGFQQIPINIDSAYFSPHQIINDVSVNSSYFFGNSLFLYNRSDVSSHLPKIAHFKATQITKRLYEKDSTHANFFMGSSKPNVVLIILEGWSANAMGWIQKGKSASPNFDRLAEQGVLFTNIYATNTTSEIGNTSLFAGYPSIPETALSLYPEKHRNLPTINEKLKENGYTTQYLFGGDLKYGNIKGFLMEHGFDKLLDENDFDPNLTRGKLNYFDSDLYKFALDEINRSRPPFLQCIFTGSTHSPYDHPPLKKAVFNGEERKYLNSMVYSDQCLAGFISNCKKQEWYKNTIFVLVSDHGHATPGINSPFETAFFRIPLLIFGDPIIEQYKGTKFNTLGSQADLAATLLHQLHLSNNDFPFSKDLMSSSKQRFAFYSTIRGYGFVTPLGSIMHNFDSRKTTSDDIADKTKFTQAKQKSEACFYTFFKHFEALDH